MGTSSSLRRLSLKTGLIILLTIVLAESSGAQDFAAPVQRDSTFWIFNRKTFVQYAIPIYGATVFYIQFQWWWKGNTHDFHIFWEGVWDDYALGVDKVGHFYTSYAYFLSLYDMMQWAGYDRSTSLWTGIGIATFHAVCSEVADGFSNFGFTPGDLAFNGMGLGYAVLQQEVPFLQNFNFKFSYWPSPNRPRDQRWRITNDYDGHIYWLSINVNGLLPESAKPYWPKFLNLAVGYGGKNISHGLPEGTPMYRKFVIGLDYNLNVFQTADDTWNTVLGILNRFHYPAPALRKTEDSKVEFKPLIIY